METRIKRAAVQTALDAGKILVKHFGRLHRIRHKGEIDIVTEADLESEGFIVANVKRLFPSHGILAEERARFGEDAEYVWVIDPLDGTVNYAHSYPMFCVSIGITYRGSVGFGVVYDPIRGEMFVAEKGRGAKLNGRRIRVSRANKLIDSLLVTGFPYDIKRDTRNLKHFSNFLLNAQAVRRDGCAALDLCYVACGRYDGFWELKLNPWDVAAGSLVLAEAGGRVSDFSGGKFDIRGREILATNGRIHGQMIKVLGG
jgi:myo-inositol-1(or 4)-monophosphatase